MNYAFHQLSRLYYLSVLLPVLLVIPADAPAQSKLKVVRDIPYAVVSDHQNLLLDLYLPESSTDYPLVIWIHGGAWHSGSKENPPVNLVHRGYAMASIEYRLSTEAFFPAQIHDIRAAIRYLRAKSDIYGYDSNRMVAWGSSAGGHLAALAGTTNGVDELEGRLGDYKDVDSSIQATINYFGPTNFLTILEQSTPHGLNVRQPALTLLLGRPLDQAEDLARLASPVFHVDESDPPMLVMHGDQDYQVPINQSLELKGAYDALDLNLELVIVHGGGHSTPHYFTSENMDRVEAFLQRVFPD